MPLLSFRILNLLGADTRSELAKYGKRECGSRVILAVMFLKYCGVDSVHMCEVKFNSYLRSC